MNVQAQLTADEELKQEQRLKCTNQERNIFALWDDYVVNKLDRKELLREVSKIYKPCSRI